jgi:nucleotide-binding universal stress UspA family protein
MPGDYQRLLDHIRVHKYFTETRESREMTFNEAVADWYDHVYMPLVQTIRENKLLQDFPDQTEADLYLWIIEHAYYLSQRMGWQVPFWEVARDFSERFSRRPRRLWQRIAQTVGHLVVPDSLEAGLPAGAWREERVQPSDTDHLFRDILVTLTGAESGWRALAQAAEIARREGGTLHGLHIARSDDPDALAYGQEVLQEFTARCETLDVNCTKTLTVGEVDETIIEHARWTDLVVINQRREHGRWAERPLGTIFQNVAEQASRPVLAVPGNEVRELDHVVLAYDGSAKAREALFIFRHLLRCWDLSGTLLTVESARTDQEMLKSAAEYAREDGDVDVTTRYEPGTPEKVILQVMEEEEADILLMGGSGYQPILRAFLGSTVDRVLREAWFPVLICR